MGNIQAYVNYHTELSLATDLNDQIQCCGGMSHPTFGNIQLWKIKQSNTLELFSITRHLYYQDSTLAAIHQQRCSLQHPNLLKYYACTQSQPTFCGSVETQSFYFEYLTTTISQILAPRTEPFSEIEVWKAFQQLADVMQYLQQNGRSHGKLCTENIFINREGKLNVLDNVDNQLTDFQLKQDVYDLGLVLVELMTKQKFHADVKASVISLQEKYTIQLLQIVARMLNKVPDKRPDFIEIYNVIKDRFRNPTSKSPEKRTPQISFTVNKFNSMLQQYCSTPQIMLPQYAHQHKVSRNNISPQRVSPTKTMRIRVSPQKGMQVKLQNLSPQKQEIQNFNSYQVLPQFNRNPSPQKINLNGSQASTNGSHGVSFMDTMNRTMMTNYLTQRQPRHKPINIQQHKSEVKRVLLKEDLNQTSSSQQNE